MAKNGDKFVLRPFQPEDYEEYAGWWPEKAPPRGSLPNIGFIVGDMKAAGFLAQTDCDFSILTWWFCNPKNEPKESYEALLAYVLGGIEVSKFIGKKYMFCYTNKRSVIRLLESLNFTAIGEGHMALEVK